MDKIPVDLLCPICLDFPEQEAYQCGQGHLICSKCIANLQKCPQCLEPFEDPKIRNRVAESLLESYKLYCPYKHLGCDKKLLKDKLETHQQICFYGGEKLNICKDFGFHCEDLVNIRDTAAIVEHLKSHECKEYFAKPSTRTFTSILNYNMLGCGWYPKILHYQDRVFLWKARCNVEKKQLDISWFELSTDSKMEKIKYQVEMMIRNVTNKGQDLKWTLPVATMMNRDGKLISAEFRVSLDLINKNYTKNGAFTVEFRIINLPDSSTLPKRVCMKMGNCVIC